jgi:tRNA modification GTPase
MNALLREERVIVTPLPGTTRDAVSEFVNIEGLPVNVIDPAGITKTKDTVEKEGIIRSKLYLNRADLILFVADLGTGLTTEDKEIIQLIKDKEAICVLNKMDIEPRKAISAPELNRHFGKEVRAVEISALKDMNLDVLRRHIHDKVFSGGVSADDYNILINARHRDSLVKALGSVREAVSSSDASRPEEVISISIGEAVSALGEVTGEAVSEEVLNRIFSRFCVGK